MDDIGILKTDEKIAKLTKRIEKNYLDAYEVAIKNNKELLKKIDDITNDKLYNFSDDEKKQIREQFKDQLLRSEKLANKIGSEIAQAGEMSSKIIQGELTGIYELNYIYGAYDIKKQTGIDLDFTVYNRNEIAILMQENESPFTKIAFNNLGKDKIIVARLQDAMTVSILNGESSQKIRKKIKEITMMSSRQAKRVVQTERNRVQSQGRQMSINEGLNLGIEVDKQWIARMIRTRESHVNLNGNIVAADKFFNSDLGLIEYPGDPKARPENSINCFCYIKPLVRSNSKALAKLRARFATFDENTTFEDYLQRNVA